MLILEVLELVHGFIRDVLELPLILMVNSSLDVLPVIGREVFLLWLIGKDFVPLKTISS